MASNYKNSAGTDLDSLFLVNNSNAGAIGFKISDGADLGNRYSNASTKLNQTIGYKNSAGTDIGYLRSNRSPMSSGSVYIKPNSDGENTWEYADAIIDGVDFMYRHDSGAAFCIIYTSQYVSNLTMGGYSLSYAGSGVPDLGSHWQAKYSGKGSNYKVYGTYTVTFTK